MAQYMLLLYSQPADWAKVSPEDFQKALEKYLAWGNKMRAAGKLVGSNKLTDGTGRILRAGDTRVTDGCFTEGKEVIGGYYIIEAGNYDEAVALCRDHPQLDYRGILEIREVDTMINH